jgi:hypothetical protein
MDRRGFLTAFFGAAAGLALTSGSAAALTLAAPAMPTPKTPPEDALLREHDENEARIEKARVVYRRGVRRRRRRVIVRRPYRYRRVYYRPIYRPRYYYRPRRVYWGPRVYRRRVWW